MKVKASQIRDALKKYVGLTENPPNSNNIIFNTRYYGRPVNGSPYAWCVTFLWNAFDELGANDLFYGGQKTASCGELMRDAKFRGQWIGDPKQLRLGDLTLFDFDGGGPDHIGFVESNDGRLHTIEGNTSKSGSQSNGGQVLEKTRAYNICVGGVRPAYVPETPVAAHPTLIRGMKGAAVVALQERLNELTFDCGKADGDFGPMTQAAVKEAQRSFCLTDDGVVGEDMRAALAAAAFPLTRLIDGVPALVGKDIIIYGAPKKGVGAMPNSISGSFNSSGEPWSIAISGGKVIHDVSCHALQGYPESVVYRLDDGTFGIARVTNVNELPAGVSDAIGGMGLLGNANSAAEGFKKIGNQDFSDVLRDTDHTVAAVKGGLWYLLFFHSMTAAQINAWLQTHGFALAVLMDGGHIAAMNGDKPYAKINTAQRQAYIVQAI